MGGFQKNLERPNGFGHIPETQEHIRQGGPCEQKGTFVGRLIRIRQGREQGRCGERILAKTGRQQSVADQGQRFAITERDRFCERGLRGDRVLLLVSSKPADATPEPTRGPNAETVAERRLLHSSDRSR